MLAYISPGASPSMNRAYPIFYLSKIVWTRTTQASWLRRLCTELYKDILSSEDLLRAIKSDEKYI